MYCQKCGTNVDDRADFCPVCGTALHGQAPSNGGYRAPITQRNIALAIVLSIVTCGIYMLYWFYKAAGKVNKIHSLNGEPQDTSAGILYLLLSLFGFDIVSLALIQTELNKVAAE